MPASKWPHAPSRHFVENGTYFVTSGTYLKQHIFNTAQRLEVLERGLFAVCEKYGWELEAWCVFSNHYHFVAHFLVSEASTLSTMLRELHSKTARWVNQLDNTKGRKVWHSYRETLLTFRSSHLARLKYTHCNAVHHGLVRAASQYEWCSARWFEQVSPPSRVETIYNIRTGLVNVQDDYDVIACEGEEPRG